jgi:hypothetical protein
MRRGTPRVPAKTAEVVAVREAIEARNAEVVTFRVIPDWLPKAMERAAEKCAPGQTPTVLIAEKPRGRNPTRIYLVTDLLQEVEAGAEWTADIAAALKDTPSGPE